MKKILMALCVLGLTVSIGADIKYDNNYRFYSSPKMSDINQEEYHQLFSQIHRTIRAFNNSDVPIKNIHNHVTSYLQLLGTPTALRLLADITKNGLFLGPIFLSYYIIYVWESVKEDYHNSPPYNMNKKEVDEFLSILSNLNLIVINCWNSGVYGEDVHKQIISYLKTLNTRVSLKFLDEYQEMNLEMKTINK